MHGSKEYPPVLLARFVTLSAIVLGAMYGGHASAQVQRSGGASPNAQVLQQLQQAVSERAHLQAENAKLKKEAEDLKKQLGTAQQQLTASKAGAGRNQAAIAAARNTNASTEKSLEEAKGKMQELVSHFRETVTSLHGVETERSQLRQQLADSQAAYDHCAESNYALYELDTEVLDRYAHQGAFSYLSRSEPFTRLKRTQIDNLVIEYQQRAQELRIQKAAAPKAGPTAVPGAIAPGGPTPSPAQPAPVPKG
jgi:chromosome segregation ATPase